MKRKNGLDPLSLFLAGLSLGVLVCFLIFQRIDRQGA